MAAARPPRGILVVAVQMAAFVLPLPAGFFSVVSVAVAAGGQRRRWWRLWGGAELRRGGAGGGGDRGGEGGDLGTAVLPAGVRRAGGQRRAGLDAGVKRRGRVGALTHHGGINGAVWIIQGAALLQSVAAPLPPSPAPLPPPLLLRRLAGRLLPVSPALSLSPPLALPGRRWAERAHRVPASTRAARPGACT